MNLQTEQRHPHESCFDCCSIQQHSSGHILSQRQSSQYYGSLATEDEQKKNELDKLLAQAMTGLTFEERQENQEIIHGVDQQKVEEAFFIESALQALEFHLVATKEGTKYEVAEQMDPAYVHNRAFLIMFLRGNEYNAKAAADQMIRFFESKCQLFGRDKLTKKITTEDLDEYGMASLETGWIQHGGRDQSGRQIVVIMAGLIEIHSQEELKGQMQATFFFFMKILQDEENQLRGTVSVWYSAGDLKHKQDGRGFHETYEVSRAIPRKKAAIHVVVDDVYQYVLINIMIKMMKGNHRARIRVHIGSDVECQYQLSTFGILSSALPVDERGRLDLTRHRNWLHSVAEQDKVAYRPLEAPKSLEAIIHQPNEYDVLYANGKTSRQAGNIRLRTIVKDYSKAYELGNGEMKRQLVATVIGKIYASGGRFLKQTSRDDSTSWEQVPEDQLKEKIMQAFRNRIRLDGTIVSRPKPSSSGVVIEGEPLPNDIILGRRGQQRNPEAEPFLRLLKDHFEQYESLDRGKKMVVVEAIMDQIKDQGGRFLVQSSTTKQWMEVSNDNVRQRISKSCRNLRRQSSKKAI